MNNLIPKHKPLKDDTLDTAGEVETLDPDFDTSQDDENWQHFNLPAENYDE